MLATAAGGDRHTAGLAGRTVGASVSRGGEDGEDTIAPSNLVITISPLPTMMPATAEQSLNESENRDEWFGLTAVRPVDAAAFIATGKGRQPRPRLRQVGTPADQVLEMTVYGLVALAGGVL